MKKILFPLLLIACMACQKEVKKPEEEILVTIPDAFFETKLVEQKIDSEGEVNGFVKKEDALKVDTLNVSYGGVGTWPGEISSLAGIEAFENLKYLDCSGQSIEKLDLSGNLNLEVLYCGGIYAGGGGTAKQVRSIDVGENRGLRILSFPYTYVKNIDFLKNQPELEVLNLTNSDISKLEIQKNKKLRKLYASACFNLYGGKVRQVDLRENTKLEVVRLFAQGLTAICVANIDFDKLIIDTVPNGDATGNWLQEETAWFKDDYTTYSLCE
ncbi:hypothetical protein [uncultured Arcticibacterium sp.]|uniref:hypothetical protein n=1 Tax=uncultured Arcticibacterium sp. TaxID=2173042 RepID=UPI0030F57195